MLKFEVCDCNSHWNVNVKKMWVKRAFWSSVNQAASCGVYPYTGPKEGQLGIFQNEY